MLELTRKSDILKDIDAPFPDPIYINALQQLESFKDGITVLQAGAFDGKTNDDLYPFLYRNKDWSGVLIEPMFDPFQDLVDNYDDRDNLHFIMKAIDIKKGFAQVWTIPYEERDNPELPSWAAGCSTIKQGVNPLFGLNCTKEEFEVLKKYTTIGSIETDIVPNILKECNIDKLDIVHIDTEGLDWEVIRQINFDKFKPKVIHYEMFSLDGDQNGEAAYFLELFGYRMFKYRNNMTAVLPEYIDVTHIQNEINNEDRWEE